MGSIANATRRHTHTLTHVSVYIYIYIYIYKPIDTERKREICACVDYLFPSKYKCHEHERNKRCGIEFKLRGLVFIVSMVVSAESKEESTADESIVEELVVLRLPQTGNLQTSSATHFRLIGLKEGKPFLQVGNEVFQGTFEKPLGTILLFGNQGNDNNVTATLCF